jgi:hypothetical protein
MTAAFSAATDPAALTRAREQVVTEHSREVMYRKALRHFSGDV